MSKKVGSPVVKSDLFGLDWRSKFFHRKNVDNLGIKIMTSCRQNFLMLRSAAYRLGPQIPIDASLFSTRKFRRLEVSMKDELDIDIAQKWGEKGFNRGLVLRIGRACK
jgi:hypothetical protein